jgi:hypothetical protein
MKTKAVIAFVLWILLTVCVSAEVFVYQDFDDSPVGSVTNTPGWVVFDFLQAMTGIVTSVDAYSPPNCLELPQPTGGMSTSLAIHVFSPVEYPGGDNNPILRFSAMIRREPTNGWQNVFLSLGCTGTMTLAITTDSEDGTIVFNHNGGIHTDTGVHFASNRYANLIMYYNAASNRVALDYDGTNILAWTDAGGRTETQLDFVVVGRLFTGSAVERKVLFDNISLQSFPIDVWAWWRFEEGSGESVSDQLGHFGVNRTDGNQWVPSLHDLYYDGEDDVRNRYGLSRPIVPHIRQQENTPVFSNWTVEAIFKALPGSGQFQICDWGVGSGFDTTNSAIWFGWNFASTNFLLGLRDGNQTTNTEETLYGMGFIPCDGRWHHVAAVKQAEKLVSYLDYVAKATATLTSVSRDEYYFDTNASISIGQTLNFGNSASTNDLFDEVRITTRALDSRDFLQPSRPVFLNMPTIVLATNWSFRAQTIEGKKYRVYFATSALGGAQHELTNFVSASLFSSFNIPAQTQRVGFISMRREEP